MPSFSSVEILPNDTVSAGFRAIHRKLYGNCAFSQNFYTKKLGEITVFYVVKHECTLHKIPQVQLFSWGAKFLETHSFQRYLNESPETLQKLCVFTKFPHQKIRRNFGILRSVTWNQYFFVEQIRTNIHQYMLT